MNPFLITTVSVTKIRKPLIQPFRTALGTHEFLENVLIRFGLSDGTQGCGEAAVATHITQETVEQTIRNLHSVGKSLIGRDMGDLLKISNELHERLKDNKCALAAIEMALFDAWTRQKKIPLWKYFGPRPKTLTTDMTIVIADLKETAHAIQKFTRQGFRIFKVKIGQDEDLDFERLVLVKKLAPRATIYLDANQGYTAKQTLRLLKRLEYAGIRPALIEQPVPRADWEGLKAVTRSTKILVCADESARSYADAAKIIKEKAAGVINIKLMKTGLVESARIARLAHTHGVGLMIGGMMETSLAMTAAAHLAAGLGIFKYVDLDTPFFIQNGWKNNPYLNSSGKYDLSKAKAGIGVTK